MNLQLFTLIISIVLSSATSSFAGDKGYWSSTFVSTNSAETWNNWGGDPQGESGNPAETSNKKATNPYQCLQNQFNLIQDMSNSIGTGDYNLYKTTITKFDMSCTVDNYLADYMEYWLIFEDQLKEGRSDYQFTTNEIEKLKVIAANHSHNASGSAMIKLKYAKEWSEKLNTTTSVNSVTGAKSIVLYPNPAQNTLVINTTGNFENAVVSIYNTLGQSVLQQTLKGNAINIEALSKGAYLIKIETNSEVYVQKFMVEK